MTEDKLFEELEREPFTPLRFHLSDGRRFEISNPDEVAVNRGSVYVFKWRRDHRRGLDDSRLISLGHIVSVEQITTPTGKPSKKSR